MATLEPAGRLNSSDFALGTKARDANAHLIHDGAKGYLCYAPDGSGAAAKQLMLCRTNKAGLGYSDIYVI